MTRLAVLLSGSIGFALVARAAMFYRRTDRLSLSLAVLIGAGLLVGVLELFLKTSRAERLGKELQKVAPSTPEALEQLGPELRNLVRRRLSGFATPSPPAWFSTYLIGLLVMIGMLGTFLGLFESLRGAREALTTSGDVDALRSALIAPLQGLSRAFGLSAAGVSASATLGLAAVFARRAEAQLTELISAAVAGPLAACTAAGRQLAALEAIASHGPALQASSLALNDAASQLHALRAELIASHEANALRTSETIRATAAEVSQELRGGIERAADATERAVGPLFDRLAERAGEVSRSHLQHWAARLEQDADARHKEQRLHLERMEQLEQDRTEAARAQLDALLRSIAERIDLWLQTVSSSGEQLMAHHDAAAQLVRERLEAVVEQVRRALAQLAEDERQRAGALQEQLHLTVVSVEKAATSSAQADAQRVQSLREAAERVRAELDRAAEAGRVRTDQLAIAVERFASVLEAMEEQSSTRMAAQVDRLLQGMAEQISRMEADHLGRTAEAAGVMDRLEASLARHLQQLGEGLSAPLAKVADSARQAPEAAARFMEASRAALDQRSAIDAQRQQRTEASLQTLIGAAQAAIRDAAEQGARIETMSRDAERRSAQAEQRAEQRLGTMLEGMRELVDQQGARLAEFEARLELASGRSMEAWAAQLSEHARGLGESVSSTATVVREAAELVRAGGAEMTCVAEMFTAAVDEYRAASERLTSGLGPIEDAMERAAQRDTVDLLGAYLDQTREVFDSSLRFQRELFSELRALRAGRGERQEPRAAGEPSA